MTSSMRPIFMPERARARRADWAPGPGVLVPLPTTSLDCCPRPAEWFQLTTSSPDLDVQRSDAQLLAAGSDILRSQHGSVGRRLVTVRLDLHAASDTGDGFAAAGITQVSL